MLMPLRKAPMKAEWPLTYFLGDFGTQAACLRRVSRMSSLSVGQVGLVVGPWWWGSA